LVNSDTFALLEGAPRLRRQFLDWGVFHVEPQFYPAWKTVIRCLKHRNKLLRHDKIRREELAVWDALLADAAEQIQACRERYWTALQPTLESLFEALGVLPGLTVRYAPGWDVQQPYREVLAQHIDRDHAQRQTVSGPHRADLVFRLEALPAADTLSRGQKKAAILALRLAQAKDLTMRGVRPPLLLLDDLPAELDAAALARVMRWVAEQDSQAFITTVSPQPLGQTITRAENIRWFHVEHGKIRAASGAHHQEGDTP
jgi:DNA replication and repair protein RecF